MRKMRNFILFFFVLLCAVVSYYVLMHYNVLKKDSSTSIDAVIIINDVKDVLKLAVVEYQAADYITLKQDDYKNILSLPVHVGTKEITLLIRGTITMGFDLEKIDENFIAVEHEKKVITLTLPEPERLGLDVDYTFLNESETFFANISEKDRNNVLKMGKLHLIKAARTKQLKEQTFQKGSEKIETLLTGLLPDYRVNVIGSRTPLPLQTQGQE